MTYTSFRIVTWNANGLALRSGELETFLVHNNVDIALISETHFTSKSYIRMYGFTLYHTTHPSGNAHAGLTVIIKNNVKYHV